MSRFRSLAAALLVIAGVGALLQPGLWWVVELVVSSAAPGAKGPHLQLVTDQQDLGLVAPGNWLEARFVIANTGQQPLVFRRARPAGCGHQPPPPLTTVAPGRASQIVLAIDPAVLASSGGRQHVNFLTNDPQRPEFWLTVVGTVSSLPRNEHSVLINRP